VCELLNDLNNFLLAHPAAFELLKASVPFIGTLLTALAAWRAVVVNNRAARVREREKQEHELRTAIHLEVAEAIERMVQLLLYCTQPKMLLDHIFSELRDVAKPIGKVHLISNINTIEALLRLQESFAAALVAAYQMRLSNEVCTTSELSAVQAHVFDEIPKLRRLQLNYLICAREETKYPIGEKAYRDALEKALRHQKELIDEALKSQDS
jgi:hypothetical protein